MIQGVLQEQFRKFLAQSEAYYQARQSALPGGATITLLQNAATGIANGATANVSGISTCVFEVSGTFSGTITFEGIILNSWVSLNVKNLSSNDLGTTSTVPGLFRANVAGLAQVRARISAYTSGSITISSKVAGEGAVDLIPQGNLSYSLDTVGIKGIPKSIVDVTALSKVVQLAIAVFSGPIDLYGIHVPASENTGGIYLKFWDSATAGAVTLGTTVPNLVFYIPDTGGYTNINLSSLQTFNSGICCAVVTGLADSNTTDVGTPLKRLKLYYV